MYPDIETILIKFCRRQLGVGSKTPIPAVLGECGMFGVHIECKIKSLKYWIRLLSQPQGSLLRACYSMLVSQCNLGRKNWASQMKDMLYGLGFGYIWELQEVTNRDWFINEFKNRLLDCEKQNWRASLMNMSKLKLYSMFKLNLETESYLLLDIRRDYRVALAKLRVGNHDLEIEKGRHNKKSRMNRICKFCYLAVEDEYHVLFGCNLYGELRDRYIENEHRTPRNLYTFCNLLSSANDGCIVKLAKFAYQMFKLRKERIS